MQSSSLDRTYVCMYCESWGKLRSLEGGTAGGHHALQVGIVHALQLVHQLQGQVTSHPAWCSTNQSRQVEAKRSNQLQLQYKGVPCAAECSSDELHALMP